MAFLNPLLIYGLARLRHCFLPARNLRHLLLPPPNLNLCQHSHHRGGSCISAALLKRRPRRLIIFNLILGDKPPQRGHGETQILRLSLLTHRNTASTSAQLRLANQGQRSKHLLKSRLSKFFTFSFSRTATIAIILPLRLGTPAPSPEHCVFPQTFP
jgi:hypothetical protein